MGKVSTNLKGGIDFKRVLIKYARNWYLFALALIIAYLIATIQNRYVVPIYSLSTSVLIEDKSNKSVLDQRGSISADPLFLNSKLIDNQIAILKSFSQIRLIIRNLNFEVSYFAKGTYIWEEIYTRAPFIVKLDTGHSQVRNVRFELKFDGKSGFQFRSEHPGGVPEVKNYRFGEVISGKDYSFSILLKDNINPADYTGQDYGFMINDLNQLTAQYRKKTNIETAKQGSVIVITSSGPNKNKEKDYLNELTRVFLVTNLEKKNRILTSTIEFIDGQILQMGADLDSAEQKLEEFRKDNKFMQLSAKATALLKEMGDLAKDRANLLSDKKYYEYLLDYLLKHNSFEDVVMPSTVGLSLPLFSDLVLKLSTVSLEKEDLIANSSRQNPYIQVLDEQISNMKVALIENMNSIIKTTQLKIDDLDKRLLEKDVDFSTLPGIERKYLEIERKYNVYNNLYDFLLQRKSETEIQRAANTPDHEILDYAGDTGITTVSASPKTAYLNALIWAILIPAVFLFLIVLLNNRILSRDDIDAITDIPVIGTLVRNTDKRTGKILLSANSAFTETLRIIKIKLNLDPTKGEQVISVTSSVIDEGKTYLAIHLASVYALAGKKTLLLGFDLHRPKISEAFNLTRSEGVTNFLINDLEIDQVIQHTYTKNLDILLSGPTPPNPDELIESEKTRELFSVLRQRYDFIIVDTPPVGYLGDAFLLNRYSDVTLYVVRYNYSTKKHFATSIAEAVENKMKRLNIVFTDVKQKVRNMDIHIPDNTENRHPAIRHFIRLRRSTVGLIRKF
ncbi:MAG: polysaccharide biosynthesis tyrosine autokinase [Bacteroidales bacterium]|nr:polysaccharide biosynthesis tyrosine autokinase [Bacteroidales bacterium]